MKYKIGLLILGLLMLAGHFYLEYFGWSWCAAEVYDCNRVWSGWGDALWAGAIFPLAILVLHWLPVRYLNAWVRYALWAFPIVFLGILLIEQEQHHSRYGMFPGLMDPIFITSMYATFIIGSLIQIFREWRKANRERYSKKVQ